MTTIESEVVEINNSAENIYNFLTDFNNFQKLMPPQVSNWSSTNEECSFTIQGMATIGMKIVDKTPFTEVKIAANGKVPFQFNLLIMLTPTEENKCKGQMKFEADLNPMMKMMLEKPLKNFFNMLAQKLKEQNLAV